MQCKRFAGSNKKIVLAVGVTVSRSSNGNTIMDVVARTRNAGRPETKSGVRQPQGLRFIQLLLLFSCRHDGKQKKCSVCCLVGQLRTV